MEFLNKSETETTVYDCIVVGLGGHGSATVARLAKAGKSVLGIERFSPAHDQGSSHGHSRVYRQAYFEDPKYVPLLKRSLCLWEELNEFYIKHNPKGSPALLNLCGGLFMGAENSEVIGGTLRSIKEHNLPHEILSNAEVQRRYPMMKLKDSEIGVFESNAGYLNPEICVETYLNLAKSLGATLVFDQIMVNWNINEENGLIKVNVTKEGENISYIGKKVILTVGAWAPELYGSKMPFKLHVERRVLYWFNPVPDSKYDYKNLPIYFFDMGESEGCIYGFPIQPEKPNLAKIAIHFLPKQTKDETGEPIQVVTSPETIDRKVHKQEIEEIRRLMENKIPSLNGNLVETATCMYTMTPDQHFLIDKHPENENIIIASPCSGHGFKFCSVIGEILKDLVCEGATSHDISLFSLKTREN